MHRRLPLLLLALLAGCVSAEEEAPSAEQAAEAVEAAGAVEPPTALPPAAIVVPLVLDGNVGTSADLCITPAAQCFSQVAGDGERSLLLEDLSGRVTGGELVLSWTPASPATSELSFGLMTMHAEACENVPLGSAAGISPLTIVLLEMPRDLCAGEVVHLWVAGNTWGDVAGAAYYQVDLDQAFRVEGHFLLAPPAAIP